MTSWISFAVGYAIGTFTVGILTAALSLLIPADDASLDDLQITRPKGDDDEA